MNYFNKLFYIAFLSFLFNGICCDFLLPFGPKHKDTFNPQADDSCSARQHLSRPFQLGSERDHLYVCNNGVISFIYAISVFDPDSVSPDWDPMIVPYISDVQLGDNLMDSICLYDSFSSYVSEFCPDVTSYGPLYPGPEDTLSSSGWPLN